jgi:DNA-directed RNA polymerase subunit RPC12/RpoP
MDIVFNCPNCDQELAVDQTGAGTQIDCPSCGQHLTIPSSGKVTTGALPPVTPPPPGALVSPIASSAAAKVALHL